MSAKQTIHQAKMAKWANLIKEQSESGLTIRQWCDKTGYTIHTYNYWKHILKEVALSNISIPDIVPLSPPAILDQDENPQHELRDSRDSRNSCDPTTISISAGDVCIQISGHVSDDVVSTIIRAVLNA